MASSNPRRRTAGVTRQADSNNGLTLKTTMTLRKSSTFHSPTTPSSSEDEDFIAPSIRRSQTNLDDVIDAHVRRVALIVDNIDKSLSISDDNSPTLPSSRKSKAALRDTSFPVPRGFLDLPVVDPAMAKEEPERRVLRPRTRRSSRHHASDSGLGTSVASSNEKRAPATPKKNGKAPVSASAITRSAATSSATLEKLPGLSSRAVNRIHEHTLRPLLAKPALKAFEPIVLDIPRRIRDKEIICLRDLEKTLIFMAPEKAKTASLYLDFCLTSIRCIQATFGFLNDRERTRSRDRPYTNLYFMDLEEQIRQYAHQLAAAKEKKLLGEVDDMDVDIKDPVRLHGGLHENGRPAELVRLRKDGKAISMATGELVDLDDEDDSPTRLKRSMSQQLEDEEEIMRSMARRKKNPTPEELAPKKCREPGCTKEFKRPCDLTKHEKTHSRPWKCPVPTCKYHEYGWPTEKEMDRHHNDKHSSAPPMYECLFKPCPYKSKRESNCKQHMEKAHNWEYVRTKTNGKKGGSVVGSVAEATPQLQHISTPSNPSIGVATPPEDHFPHFPPFNHHLDYPTYLPNDDFLATIGQQPLDIDLDDITMDGLDMSPLDHNTPSSVSSYDYSGYQDGPEFTLNEDLYTAPVHLPTPDPVVYGKAIAQTTYQTYHATQACQTEVIPAPHISPIGQGNAMLYTPNSLADVDESFEEYSAGGNVGTDFQLYPNAGKTASYEPLFGEVPSAGLGYSQPSQDLFAPALDWGSTEFHGYHNQQ